MRYVLVLLLLAGCSNSTVDRAKLLKNAENYCSCHDGLWTLENYPDSEIIGITCNDGIYTTLKYNSLVLGNCLEK